MCIIYLYVFDVSIIEYLVNKCSLFEQFFFYDSNLTKWRLLLRAVQCVSMLRKGAAK